MPVSTTKLLAVLGLDDTEFRARLKGASRQLSLSAREMQKKGRRLSILSRELFMGLALPAGLFGKAVFDATREMDQMRRGLTTIAKSKGITAIDKLLKDTTALAKLPGLGLRESFKGVQDLIALGKSGDEAMTIIKGLGIGISRAGGSAEAFDRVMRQLTQGLSKGRLEMTDFKTVFEQMPEARGILEEYFGPGMADLDALRKKGIGVHEVIDALASGFTELGAGGAMDSLQNATDNLSDSWLVLRATIGEEIFGPNIKESMNWFDQVMKDITETINKMSPETKKAIADFVWLAAKALVVGLSLMQLRKVYLLLNSAIKGSGSIHALVAAFGNLNPYIWGAVAAFTAMEKIGRKIDPQWRGIGGELKLMAQQLAAIAAVNFPGVMSALFGDKPKKVHGRRGGGGLGFLVPKKPKTAGGGGGGGDTERDITKGPIKDLSKGIYDDLRESTVDMAKNLPAIWDENFDIPSIQGGFEHSVDSAMFDTIAAGAKEARVSLYEYQIAALASAESMAQLTEMQEKFNGQLEEVYAGAIGQGIVGIADAFGAFVDTALTDAPNAFKELGKSMKTAVKDMIVSLIKLIAKLAIAAALVNILFPNAGGLAGFAGGKADGMKGAKFMKGILGGLGIPGFAGGGMVGAGSPHGDKILARLNSGEMVLNPAQQAGVASAMNAGGVIRLEGELRARGRDLVYVVEETQKRLNGTR